MKCSNCGKEIDNNSLFCAYCGAKVNPNNSVNASKKTNSAEKKKQPLWLTIIEFIISITLMLLGWSYFDK